MTGPESDRDCTAGRSTPTGDSAVRHRLRRGMLELDLILGRFHETVYPDLDERDRRGFARLLDSEDDLLWEWLTGRSDPRDPDYADAVRRIRRHAGL